MDTSVDTGEQIIGWAVVLHYIFGALLFFEAIRTHDWIILIVGLACWGLACAMASIMDKKR